MDQQSAQGIINWLEENRPAFTAMADQIWRTPEVAWHEFKSSRLQADFMEKEGATVWKGISSLLMYVSRVGALSKAHLKNLRTVMFAGESLSVKYLADWMRALPHAQFHNCYGPTEATGVSISYHVPGVPRENEKIPIGQPCKEGMRAFLIDDSDAV